MNKRNKQLMAAIAILVVALILSYSSTQKKEIVKDADVVLALDVSGSMGDPGQSGTKLDDAKKSATEFLRKVEPKFRIGLVTFESDVYLDASLESSREYLIDQIGSMDSGGNTALGDAMALSIEHLTSKGRSNVDKYIVLMTDGLQTEVIEYDLYEATEMAVSDGIMIYTVAFGSDAALSDLRNIAGQTGGQYFYAASGSELVDRFVQVAEQISRKPEYYYGSRSLMAAVVFLIIFLPTIVKTGKIAVDAMKEKFMKV